MSMSGACSYFSQDVPPFILSTGNPAKVRSLNLIGLRTSKVNPMGTLPTQTIKLLKRAFRILFRSKLNMSQAIKKVRQTIEPNEQVEYLLRFIEASKRGIGM
jgi:UDP-N-acetylglucosamine acyltransferase